MGQDDYFEANRASWDDRVPVHVASQFYDVPAFLAGQTSLLATDLAEMGDVTGKTLVHLQCHFGMDTLSWARLGATATGLDFSPAAIEAARKLSAESGVPGRFVEANVYNAAEALGGEQFDIVYVNTGAICWLPDIRRWAQVVGQLVKPGGWFYMHEGHPVLWSLDDEREDQLLVIRYPYFEAPEPVSWEDTATYTDGPPIAHAKTYEWNHGLGEVITALIDAGLRIEFVHEQRDCGWQALPWMVRGDDGRYRLPEGQERVPLMYSLRAVKE